MSSMWQHPYVNLFKHYGVGQWKKCTKEGDVTSFMDRDIKATVYRISGTIPASNYIHLPKTSSQSLSLVGQYVYLVFKPLPLKYFVIHMEAVSSTGMVIRISFSNLFKEFKSTSTWLQFPFVEGGSASESGRQHQPGDSPRWSLLVVDLKTILSKYVHSTYAYLKNLKLCANLVVKNVFTSEHKYSPLVDSNGSSENKYHGYAQPLPRELALPLPKGSSFVDVYNYIQFPFNPDGSDGSQRLTAHVPLRGRQTSAVTVSSESRPNTQQSGHHHGSKHTRGKRYKTGAEGSSASQALVKHLSSRTPSKNIASEYHNTGHTSAMVTEGERGEEVHVYAEQGAEVTIHQTQRKTKNEKPVTKERTILLRSSKPKKQEFKSLQPDPILKLNKVIGFGGHTTTQLLFSGDGSSVIYPCHSLVVDMEIATRKQRFFIGHTDKVSCLSLNDEGTLLASGQTGSVSVVRVWRYENQQCLALFKTHSSGLHFLSFSHSGGVLCGVGKDSHGKSLVVLWNTSRVGNSGEVRVLSKAHTEASIEKMRIAKFDDSRMVSCGWDNVRFWRVRNGSLRSCPVNLEEHHQLHFTDVMFQPGYHNDTDLTDRNVYVCTKNGYLFEINYKRIVVQRVWHLLPSESGGVAIHTLDVHEAFCVTGSEDGVLRVWPLDFSAVFMEAEHEGAVTAVVISDDGLRILAGTSSGNIGLLDANSKEYTTLMRSHTCSVLSVSVNNRAQHLVTCSEDHTIRVWDIHKPVQLFDFRAPNDGTTCVVCHPKKQLFACGFTSGAVRVFHTPSTAMLAEHKHHSGGITGLVFSPSGGVLYSSSTSGSLAMYDTSDEGNSQVLRLMSNTVAKGESFGARALSLSEDGTRIAFIGPLDFTITVLDATTFEELLRLDITPTASTSTQNTSMNRARLVTFTPQALNQLLVITDSARLIKFSATNGQLLSEVAHIHRTHCTSLSVDGTGRYLLTAGDKTIKVWDYSMALDLNFQVFIGHSDAITQVGFTPNGDSVISCGDALFIWDFLGRSQPCPSTPPPSSKPSNLLSTSPRKKPPAPASYEPLKAHNFTPLAPTPRHRDKACSDESPCNSTEFSDDQHYEPHTDSEERETLSGTEHPHEDNINAFKHRIAAHHETSDVSSDSAGEDDIVVEKHSDGEVEVTVKPEDPPQTSIQPSSASTALNPSQSKPTAQKHYYPTPPQCPLAQHLYMAPPQQAGMRRKNVLGLSGTARNNVMWQPNTGLFVYSSGCIVVIEDLSSGQQTHLTGHTEEVSTLALRYDGYAAASASPAFDSTPCEIRVWKMSSGKCLKVLTFHRLAISCLAYSRDDRLLLSVGNIQDGSLAVWSAHDYSLLVATNLEHAIHDVRWDPYTAYEFTSVGAGQCISFWMIEEDTQAGENKYQLKVHQPPLPGDLIQAHSVMEFTSLSYASNSTIFIGSNKGIISVWDTKENKCLLYWKTDPSEISTMLATGDKLLTCNVDGTLQLWTVDSTTSPPTVVFNQTMEVDGPVFSASFDNQLDLGVVGTASGTVWYISWSEPSKVKLIYGHSGCISAISFMPDGSHFASCSLDGSLALWSVESMEQTVLFQASKKACTCVTFSSLPASSITSIQGQDDGIHTTLPETMIAGYSDGTVRVFDAKKAQMVRKMHPHGAPVKALSYSHDDDYVIISGCVDGVVAISNSRTGIVVRVITDHQGAPITDLQVSRRPTRLPSLGIDECYLWLVASADRRVSLWSSDWRKDHCQLVDWLTFPGPGFAPDGTRLKRGNKCQYELLPPSLARFSPSSPDTIIYTGYGMEKCVQFYSISKKAVVRTAALTHWPTTMSVSPLGHLLAFGCQERVVKLMDYDEASFQDFTGYHDSVGIVTFSPCGKTLISTSHSTIHVWEIMLQ